MVGGRMMRGQSDVERGRRVRWLVEENRVMVERRSGAVLVESHGHCEWRVSVAAGVDLVLGESGRVMLRKVRLGLGD